MPPFLARLLRTPACRQYSIVLLDELRKNGHPSILVVGTTKTEGHAWVEANGMAFELESLEPKAVEEVRARYLIAKEYF